MKLREEADLTFGDLTLTDQQRAALIERLQRRSKAAEIAVRASVDAGDVEHVLHNLTLTPEKRLSQSFTRARLWKWRPAR